MTDPADEPPWDYCPARTPSDDTKPHNCYLTNDHQAHDIDFHFCICGFAWKQIPASDLSRYFPESETA